MEAGEWSLVSAGMCTQSSFTWTGLACLVALLPIRLLCLQDDDVAAACQENESIQVASSQCALLILVELESINRLLVTRIGPPAQIPGVK